MHFVIYGHSLYFEKFSNCTHLRLVQLPKLSKHRWHKLRNVLAFMWFPILISHSKHRLFSVTAFFFVIPLKTGTIKVVYHSRKCMKILGLEEGGGGVLTLLFRQGFWWRDWAGYACTLSRGRWSRDYTRHIWIHFLIGKIVCRITLKVSPNCLNLLDFGSFAGAGAHHQGLRSLNLANFKELFIGTAVNVTNFVQTLVTVFVEVSSKVESAWTTVGARFKPGQRRGQKIANCLEVDFPAQS